MRLWCLVVVVAVACGPSAAEIKTAKDASYAANAQEVYRVAEEETAKSYSIAERMPDELIFATKPQWFSDRGRSSDDSDEAQKKAGHMQVSFVVLVMPEGENRAKVSVSAKAVDYEPNKPKPKQLSTEDKLPKWVIDRANKLQVTLHKRLSSLKPGAAPPVHPAQAGSAASSAAGSAE